MQRDQQHQIDSADEIGGINTQCSGQLLRAIAFGQQYVWNPPLIAAGMLCSGLLKAHILPQQSPWDVDSFQNGLPFFRIVSVYPRTMVHAAEMPFLTFDEVQGYSIFSETETHDSQCVNDQGIDNIAVMYTTCGRHFCTVFV